MHTNELSAARSPPDGWKLQVGLELHKAPAEVGGHASLLGCQLLPQPLHSSKRFVSSALAALQTLKDVLTLVKPLTTW